MKTSMLWVTLFLSAVACKTAPPGEGANTPPVVTTGATSGAAAGADGGSGDAPATPSCESATACDTCLAISGCNWSANHCLPTCALDTSCYGPANPAASQCPSADASAPPADASAPAPTSTLVGAHSLAFRAGAHPPLGAPGAHGATVWAVTVAASAPPVTALTALFEQATAAHMAADLGDVGCSAAVGGAYPSTMPTGDGVQILTVTFRSERDARQFAAALTETPLRVGRVRVTCGD